MRVRIRIADYDLEFVGSAAFWNESLRPILGGPVADETTERNHTAKRTPPEPTSAVADAPDGGNDEGEDRESRTAEETLDALAEAGGRRAEKDAVLVAVQIAAGARDEATFDAVARLMHARDGFRTVRVKPHLLKHINRTRMLDSGATRETALLTEKGRRYVRSLLT